MRSERSELSSVVIDTIGFQLSNGSIGAPNCYIAGVAHDLDGRYGAVGRLKSSLIRAAISMQQSECGCSSFEPIIFPSLLSGPSVMGQ